MPVGSIFQRLTAAQIATIKPGTRAGDTVGALEQLLSRAPALESLKRAQEVHEVLLLGGGQRVVAIDHGVRLGRAVTTITSAAMSADRFNDVGRATVVQKKCFRAHAPQRRGAKLVAGCPALHDIVSQSGTHAV